MNKLLKLSGNEKWREFAEVDEEGIGEQRQHGVNVV